LTNANLVLAQLQSREQIDKKLRAALKSTAKRLPITSEPDGSPPTSFPRKPLFLAASVAWRSLVIAPRIIRNQQVAGSNPGVAPKNPPEQQRGVFLLRGDFDDLIVDIWPPPITSECAGGLPENAVRPQPLNLKGAGLRGAISPEISPGDRRQLCAARLAADDRLFESSQPARLESGRQIPRHKAEVPTHPARPTARGCPP
jgi:hypothetical protein